jgi:hypothetical protein
MSKCKVRVFHPDLWINDYNFYEDLGQRAAGTEHARSTMSLARLVAEVSQTSSSRCLNGLSIPSSGMTLYATEIYRFDYHNMPRFAPISDIRCT